MKSPKAPPHSPKAAIKEQLSRQEETGSPIPKKSALEQLEASPKRNYQFTNLQDITFDHFNANGSNFMGGNLGNGPKVLKYFLENNRFQATSVLEESVINNEIMKQNAFLKNFSPGFVEEMLGCEEHIRAVVYMPNQVIVHQGAPGDSMMVIAKGIVEVSIGGKPVNRLGEGSFFGELVLVGAANIRTATITSVTFCDLRVIYRRAFMQILSKYPSDQAMLATLVNTRLHMVENIAPKVALSDKFSKARRGKTSIATTKPSGRLSVFTRSAVQGCGTEPRASSALPAVQQDEAVAPGGRLAVRFAEGPLASTAWAVGPVDDDSMEPESILGTSAIIAAGGADHRPRRKQERSTAGGARSPTQLGGSMRLAQTGAMGRSTKSWHKPAEPGEGPRMPKIGWQIEEEDESAIDMPSGMKNFTPSMKLRGGPGSFLRGRPMDLGSAA